jgi:1-acyl-sn-glycerol-3-phosphate acyltransferase
MRFVWRSGLVAIMYFGFGLFGLILSYVRLPLALRGIEDPEQRIRASTELLRRWTRSFLRWMERFDLIRFHDPEIPAILESGKPAVVVANHPSFVDVLFLVAVIPDIAYVAKAAWFRSPLIGPILRSCDHIPGPAGQTPADGAIVLEHILNRLQRGRPVLIFPEGTRSPLRDVHPFQRGAFEAAMRSGVPVVPFVLSFEPSILRKDQAWHYGSDRPVDARAYPLATILPEEFPRSARALAKRLRADYRAELSGEFGHQPANAPLSVADATTLAARAR